MLTRPTLRQVPLAAALPIRPGALVVTMARGQWDALLLAAYQSGALLLELDRDERPVAAYQRPGQAAEDGAA
jgi:hypothetical protein